MVRASASVPETDLNDIECTRRPIVLHSAIITNNIDKLAFERKTHLSNHSRVNTLSKVGQIRTQLVVVGSSIEREEFIRVCQIFSKKLK